MLSKIVVLCLLAMLLQTGYALKCHTYEINSHDGFPALINAPLTTCNDQQHFCATLGWSSKITSGEVVHFKRGVCATSSVCQQFCRALYKDEVMGQITRQCQHQCCSGESCNKTN